MVTDPDTYYRYGWSMCLLYLLSVLQVTQTHFHKHTRYTLNILCDTTAFVQLGHDTETAMGRTPLGTTKKARSLRIAALPGS